MVIINLIQIKQLIANWQLKCEHEDRTSARLRDKINNTIELFNHGSTYAESETNAINILLLIVFKSGEKFEQLLLVLSLDSFSRVMNLTVNFLHVVQKFDFGCYAALKGEF